MPATSMEEMTFAEPRTVLFAVGEKDSIETKLSWRWARDNVLLASDNVWLVRCRRKQSGWIPLDSVRYLSDASLAKDWLPSEIAHTIRGMEHKLVVIDTTHDPGEALVKFCEVEVPKDALLICGSRGRQGWRKYLLGSVSSYVVQRVPLPVLVVRSRKYRDIPDLTSDTVGSAYLGMTPPGKRRVVALALDGGPSSLPLVKWAREYVIKTRDDVHLLHAAAGKTPEQTSDASETIRRCVAELEAFFAESAETSAENRGTTTSVLLDGASDLRDQLVDYVDELGGTVDLLIVGTRGIRGALKRFALGSVSSYCLAYANAPVLVVPGAVAREAAGPQDETDETRARADGAA